MARRNILRKSASAASAGYFPVLPSTQTASKVEGAMGLHRDLADTFSSIASQNSLVRKQGRLQRLQARREGQATVQSQVGSQLERGMLGSTTSRIQSALTKSDTEAQVLDIKNDTQLAEMQNATLGQQAVRDYRTGLLNLMMAEKAGLSDQAALDLLNSAVGAATGGGGGAGPGAGGAGIAGAKVDPGMLRKLAGAKNIRGLASRIETLKNGLYDVSELEGFQGTGSIASGHSPYSNHYGDTPEVDGTGFDTNTTRKNNTPFEAKMLNKLAAALKQLYGDKFIEMIPNEANAGTSGIHGHFATKSRKLRK